MRTLETQRLILRQPQPRDQGAYATFFLSDRARFVQQASSRFNAWKIFAAEIGHWAMYGYGPWVVTEKGSDQAIGSVGSWHPDGFPERELGWLMFTHEGYGYAFEAAAAARLDDYRTHDVGPLVSYIHRDNTRSIALAERLGAWRDNDAPNGDPENDYVYRHPALGALT